MDPALWRPLVLLTHAAGLAVLSHIAASEWTVTGSIGFVLAGVLLLWGLDRRWALIEGPVGAGPGIGRPLTAHAGLQIAYLLVSAVLLGLAFVWFADNTFTLRGVVFWIGGLICFLVGVWERPADRPRRSAVVSDGSPSSRQVWFVVALLVVMALAVFFRFHHLSVTPVEMTSDHAEKLIDVNDVLEGKRPIFFERNTGREAIQFYVTALLIHFTDLEVSHLALKVGTAFFGLMAIPFAFLLGRELYNRDVGLMAAGLVAVSHWHVAITRVGLRFPFTAAFATPVLFFLFRAFRLNQRRDWILVGAFLGVGLHTYIPMRIVPLLLVALCVAKLVMDVFAVVLGRRESAVSLSVAFWVNAIIGAATSLILFLPLARYIYDEPEMFWMRAASRAVPEDMGAAEILRVFFLNLRDGVMMFSYIGDRVAVNTIGGSPFLGWVTGGLFVLGLWYLVWSTVRGADRRPIYLLICLFFLILPSVLSISFPKENPSAVRTAGAVPIVMIIAALPLYSWMVAAGRFGRKLGQAGKLIAPVGLAMVAAGCIAYNYNWYFVRYHNIQLGATWNTRDLGAVLHRWLAAGGHPDNANQIIYRHWVDTRLVGIHAGDITWSNALQSPEDLDERGLPRTGRLFFLHPDDERNLTALRSLFPTGRWEVDPSSTPGRGKEFVIFEVPPAGDPNRFLILSPQRWVSPDVEPGG